MIYNHSDLNKPYYVSKNDDNTIFNYGKILENQVFSTSRPITSYVHEKSMINFIERHGGEYIEIEI
jgi:hypothetical protein